MQRSALTDDGTRRYVRVRRLAALLDVNPATVWRWVASGRLPAPHRLSPGVTAWRLDEVERALAALGEGRP